MMTKHATLYANNVCKAVFLSLFAILSIFIFANQSVQADTIGADKSEYINSDLAKVIKKNVRLVQHKDGKVEVYLKNKSQVKSKLLESGYSYTELNSALTQINQYFEKNQNELIPNYSPFRKKGSGTCSKALQFIGYVHGGAYATAAALMGVSGPVAVIAPILIGLVYQAGSLLC